MSTSVSEMVNEDLRVSGVRFTPDRIFVALSDQREIGLPLEHTDLRWLKNATPEQRAKWTVAPGGWAVLWEELGDGIEVEHLLRRQPLSNG